MLSLVEPTRRAMWGSRHGAAVHGTGTCPCSPPPIVNRPPISLRENLDYIQNAGFTAGVPPLSALLAWSHVSSYTKSGSAPSTRITKAHEHPTAIPTMGTGSQTSPSSTVDLGPPKISRRWLLSCTSAICRLSVPCALPGSHNPEGTSWLTSSLTMSWSPPLPPTTQECSSAMQWVWFFLSSHSIWTRSSVLLPSILPDPVGKPP